LLIVHNRFDFGLLLNLTSEFPFLRQPVFLQITAVSILINYILPKKIEEPHPVLGALSRLPFFIALAQEGHLS
jgi:hypothetical protein